MTIEEALKLAMKAHAADDLKQAEMICRRVLEVVPNHPGAMNFLGVMANQVGRNAEALQWLEKAIALNPTVGEFHENLGRILMALGRMDESIAAARKAIELNPNHHRGYQNLSVVLGRQGFRREALAACRKALELKPDYAEAHWNLAISLLQLGEFAEGWKEFDLRMDVPRLRLNRGFARPKWAGEDLAGKTLLLHAEGGFGDALQFIRYVPMLRDRNARLILECQPGLVRLFSRVAGPEQVIPRGQALPDFDFHIPLQSLPRIFGTVMETIPHEVPYLSAPPDRLAYWAGKIPKDGAINVGLNWAGSGVAPAAHDPRSRYLRDFAPLAQVSGVRFHSVQVGLPSAEPRPPGFDVINHSAELHDFAETAALMQQMDLIITVDTSVPHLAGALGLPVWVLMPFEGDFRWLVDREDSPWYPTLRLFREPVIRDWRTPMGRIVEALKSFQKRVV